MSPTLYCDCVMMIHSVLNSDVALIDSCVPASGSSL